jgi:hypothetical protein
MTAAMLVLEPIFEADLPPEQYAYRPGRNAQQAVVEVEKQLFRVASASPAPASKCHLTPTRYRPSPPSLIRCDVLERVEADDVGKVGGSPVDAWIGIH